MRYIAAEDVAKAKEMDLLTYLRNYEPQELVHVSGNTYCTREHDSLRISNGKWCCFSQGMEPAPGMIIFFDWDNKGSSGPQDGQDGQADHVGIVQKVENGIVYTIEGNSGDSCRVNQYPVGYYEILGYGVAA